MRSNENQAREYRRDHYPNKELRDRWLGAQAGSFVYLAAGTPLCSLSDVGIASDSSCNLFYRLG